MFISNISAGNAGDYISTLDYDGEGASYAAKLTVGYSSTTNEYDAYDSNKKRWLANCTTPNLGKVGLQDITVFVNDSGTIVNSTNVNAIDFGTKTLAEITLYLNGTNGNDSTYLNGIGYNISINTTPTILHGNITANFRNSSVQFVIGNGYQAGFLVPSLMYHNVVDSSPSTYDITTSLFSQHMQYLYEHGYNPITFAEYVNYHKNNKTVPFKTVVIYHDDSRKGFYNNARPILNKYNFTVTIATISNRTGTDVYMNTTMLDDFVNDGSEIASHGYMSLELTTLSKSEREIEINQSKAQLEGMGYTVTTFVYPGGKDNSTIRGEVRTYGYDAARDTSREVVGGLDVGGYLKYMDNEYKMPAYMINESIDLTTFANIVDRVYESEVIELEDIVEVYNDAGSNQAATYVNLANDSHASLTTGDTGDAFNFSIYFTDTANYTLKFRVKTGTSADCTNTKTKNEIIINGTRYTDALGNLETDTSNSVVDSEDSNICWGTQTINNTKFNKGWYYIILNATADWGPYWDYMVIQKMNPSTNIESIFNISYWVNETGNYTIYGLVSGDSDYNNNSVSYNLEIMGVPISPNTCSCPSPAADWHMSIADNCNITSNCYDDGYTVYFENGTSSDMVNISAMIVADNFDYSIAGAGTIIHLHSGAYLNTS